MGELSDVERADRLGMQRARILPPLVLIFIAGQFAYWTQTEGERAVDNVRLAAWAVYVVIFLLFLGQGGGWFVGSRVRALLNDESFRLHQVRAQAAGFWGAVLTGFVLFFVARFQEVSASEVIHLVVSIGIAVAVLTLAWLEHRAHRDA